MHVQFAVQLHDRRHPDCDCGACCDRCGHTSPCTSNLAPTSDVAEEVAQEDGYMRPVTKRICKPQNA